MTSNKCLNCNKTVFLAEETRAAGALWHKMWYVIKILSYLASPALRCVTFPHSPLIFLYDTYLFSLLFFISISFLLFSSLLFFFSLLFLSSFLLSSSLLFSSLLFSSHSFTCGAASESKSGCQRVLAKDNFTQLQGVPMCKVNDPKWPLMTPALSLLPTCSCRHSLDC